MRFVGLTGGIGSGKSTVAAMLAARGAVVVDSDRFAREALAPGTPGFKSAVALFGSEVVDADGELDRARIAQVVFADPEARRALEAIVHPEVARATAAVVQERRDTDEIVVLESPLLIETGTYRGCDVVVVVAADPERRVARLVERGMDAADARARIAAQMPAAEQAALADVVLDNDGTVADLAERVGALWRALSSAR